MDKMLRKSAGVEFLRLAGEIERCRGSLEPLHVPFGKRVTPFSTAENRTLADLFFRLPDPTDAAFFKQALFLLVSPRLGSLLSASPPKQTGADLPALRLFLALSPQGGRPRLTERGRRPSSTGKPRTSTESPGRSVGTLQSKRSVALDIQL